MISTGLGLQRHHKSVESSASPSPATTTPTYYIPDTAEDLLDQVLRVIHGCTDRLFVGFTDSTFRHTCRPEHRWFALIYYIQLNFVERQHKKCTNRQQGRQLEHSQFTESSSALAKLETATHTGRSLSQPSKSLIKNFCFDARSVTVCTPNIL